jgi:hypothetical protein
VGLQQITALEQLHQPLNVGDGQAQLPGEGGGGHGLLGRGAGNVRNKLESMQGLFV